MRGERRLLRVGEFLVRRACQRLPAEVREERYREWAAELPAILHDPQVRFAPRRAARMLGYAADTLRGTAVTSVRARHKIGADALFYLSLAAVGLVLVALSIQDTVRAPGHGLNYVQLAWELLLVAMPVSKLVRSTERTGVLLALSSCLAGAVYFLWNAALAPGDWVNFFVAAWFLLGALAIWRFTRRARARRA